VGGFLALPAPPPGGGSGAAFVVEKGRRSPSAKKKVAGILRSQHLKGLFAADVSERSDGLPALNYRFKHSAYEKAPADAACWVE
jgi:hypothetical protein